MRIRIVTPAPPGSLKGNRITAERWAGFLREVGHSVEVASDWTGEPCDLLIALHAYKSSAAVRRWRAASATAPLLLCLTGTDLYGDIHDKPEAVESLEAATRLVVLQPLASDELPPHLRNKARVVFQSVESPPLLEPKRGGVFDVCLLGHLREVKDPFRTEQASRSLPDSSRVRVLHLGAALDEEMASQAREAMAANPRYEWLGELPRAEALRVLSRCRLLSLTSRLEGGANAISEALAVGVPVVSSRIAGSVGLLGEDYPGYFPFGDTQALAALLRRCETESGFLASLAEACRKRRPLFEPARERESLRLLVEQAASP